MSEAFPDAMVNDDHREFILNQLYKWAEAGALTKTAQLLCNSFMWKIVGNDLMDKILILGMT